MIHITFVFAGTECQSRFKIDFFGAGRFKIQKVGSKFVFQMISSDNHVSTSSTPINSIDLASCPSQDKLNCEIEKERSLNDCLLSEKTKYPERNNQISMSLQLKYMIEVHVYKYYFQSMEKVIHLKVSEVVMIRENK